MDAYVRPMARHRTDPARFLLRDEENQWFVWQATAPNDQPEEIDEEVAWWMISEGWVETLSDDCGWVHAADLPLAADARPGTFRR